MMYTITRGPSKLVTQRRTGPPQQVESKLVDLKCRQQQQHQPGSWTLPSPTPKLVFNRVNGKRSLVTTPRTTAIEERYTLAHEENVRFVNEAWQQVERQLDNSQPGEQGSGPVQYMEKTPNPDLNNFVPIDLDEWWWQQFLAKIKNGS